MLAWQHQHGSSSSPSAAATKIVRAYSALAAEIRKHSRMRSDFSYFAALAQVPHVRAGTSAHLALEAERSNLAIVVHLQLARGAAHRSPICDRHPQPLAGITPVCRPGQG